MSKQNQTIIVGFGLIFLAIMPIFSVRAQDIEIFPAESITVTIGDEPAWLSYSAQAGEIISIIASAQNEENRVDTMLEILYPDGQRLAYADDSILPDASIQSDASLSNLSIPTTGNYRIRVDSFNGVSEGEVVVSLTFIENPPDEAMTVENLRIIRAQIPRQGVYRYALDVKAGETWSIMARDVSGNLDPVLRLVSADGDVIAMNDDHLAMNPALNVLDAYLADVSAQEDTSWLIEVYDFFGESGRLELIISP